MPRNPSNAIVCFIFGTEMSWIVVRRETKILTKPNTTNGATKLKLYFVARCKLVGGERMHESTD